jgi:hypothetical protein
VTVAISLESCVTGFREVAAVFVCPKIMLTRILLYFGIALIDLDLVARALASDMLRLHGPDIVTLDEYGATRELKRRYALLAIEAGLPIAAQATVAGMAWKMITTASDEFPKTGNRKEFSFYA